MHKITWLPSLELGQLQLSCGNRSNRIALVTSSVSARAPSSSLDSVFEVVVLFIVPSACTEKEVVFEQFFISMQGNDFRKVFTFPCDLLC